MGVLINWLETNDPFFCHPEIHFFVADTKKQSWTKKLDDWTIFLHSKDDEVKISTRRMISKRVGSAVVFV